MNEMSNEEDLSAHASSGNTSDNPTEETDSATRKVAGESGSLNDSSSDSPTGGRAAGSSND